MTADLEAGLYRLIRFNPCVTIHELRLRMRGVRAFWVLFFYAGIAAGTFLITMWVTAWQSALVSGPGMRQPNLGRIVLTVLAYTQLTLVLLILPAYSAGAITMEREKRTIEMLRATLLSPGDIVTGKLLVVLALGVVLLLTTLPIAAWSLLLGGVAPEEIAMIYSYLLAAAVFSAALGMLFSALLGRSLGAVVATYAALLAIAIVPAVVVSIMMSVAMATARGPASLMLGPTWGAVLVGAVGAICAWLLFLAVRWVWVRVLGRRLGRLAAPAAALVGLVFLQLLLWPGGPVLKQVAKLRATWIIMVEPYVTLVGLLEGGDVTRELIGYSHSVGSSPISVQFLVWAVSSAALLVSALFCWALSIRTYRVRA